MGMFNGTPLVYKTGEYTRENNEVMRVSNWAMIWSKLALVKTNDSLVPLGDGYIFVDFVAGKTKINYPKNISGSFKGISFQLGIDSVINHSDPTVWGPEHPLNANLTGLHWGWASGYIFQALDGTFKTKSGDANWQGLTLHTATDQFTKKIFVPFNFTLDAAGPNTINIEAWVDEYFKNPVNMDFTKDGISSHSVGSKEIAIMKTVLGNAGDVFRIKDVK